jgi:hypothetical protein
MKHLPDLPSAGYLTRRQRETSDAIMIFMRGVERDRPLLLSIVLDGLETWLKTAGTVWRGLLIDKDVLTSIFRYFELQAGPNPAEQLLILEGQKQQQAREAWDKRASTRVQFQKAQRAALADLKRYGKQVVRN